MPSWLWLAALVAAPWWDDYPTTVQTSNPAQAAATGASSCLSGIADDPVWGLHGARIRWLWLGPMVPDYRRLGLKVLTWVETFGTCEEYVAAFPLDADGKPIGHEREPETPYPWRNHWGWQTVQPGPGLAIHWVGPRDYYEASPFAGPWTREHPRYGAPPFTYPDGRPAGGTPTVAGRPETARLYDAGCAKDILGRLAVDWEFNAKVNAIDPATGRPHGPTDGLVPVETPEGIRWAGLVSFGKDAACPHWIDYARASGRLLVDGGVEGLWADNYSAWDAIGNPPVGHAFGEWSVARFRDWLKAHPARSVEIGDPDRFDVRAALRQILRERFGGDDTNLRDPAWRDSRWLDEPLWLAYLTYKTEVGAEALQRFHAAFHDAAVERGVGEFGIQGNDIPLFSFGMPRPEWLEMVSTEFSPGWNLFTGPRGLGLPPGGRLAPLVKAARVHGRGRFVHLWYYLDQAAERYRGSEALGRVLSYELLANHAMIQCHTADSRVAGTVASHREVNDFIARAKSIWGDCRPLARIALVYSPTSELATLTPGGFVDFAAQRHRFDLLGWGTLLSELHAQYDVLAEWELTPTRLADLAVLVLPSVEALAPEVVTDVLRPWVAGGGRLLLSGSVGARYDTTRGLGRVANVAGMLPELCELCGLRPDDPRADGMTRVGDGTVVRLPAVGFDYYQSPPGQREPAGPAAAVQPYLSPFEIVGAGLPRAVEVVTYASPARGWVFVDLANLDLDPDRDAAPRPHEVTLRLSLPTAPAREPRAEVLAPGAEPVNAVVRTADGSIVVGPFTLRSYASVVLRPE